MKNIEESKIARQYDVVGKVFPPTERMAEEIISLCFSDDAIRDKIVLDAGCGTGPVLCNFAKKGAKKVFGIDISQGSLNTARELASRHKLENVELSRMSVTDLNFPADLFDIVFAQSIWPYIDNKKAVVQELLRVTKKNGILIISEHKEGKWEWLFNLLRRVLVRLPVGTHLTLVKIMSGILTNSLVRTLAGSKVSFHEDKKPDHTLFEVLFSPVVMKWPKRHEFQNILNEEDVNWEELKLTPELRESECLIKVVKN